MSCFAWTPATGPGYPPYLNISVVDDNVRLIMRAPPTIREGVYVCMYKPGPGNCQPGDANCNNYCNMAPQKGPMQDHPKPCTHVDEGKTSEVLIPVADWVLMGLPLPPA